MLLMVIRDFDFECIVTTPHKADPILIVDSNAVLSLAIAAQLFQSIARRTFQIVQSRGSIEHR